MEAALERDFARASPSNTRHILNSFIDLIPGGKKLVGGGSLRGFDSLVSDDKRVELDDFAMTVKHVDGKLTGDMGRNGGDVRVNGFLLHHGSG